MIYVWFYQWNKIPYSVYNESWSKPVALTNLMSLLIDVLEVAVDVVVAVVVVVVTKIEIQIAMNFMINLTKKNQKN